MSGTFSIATLGTYSKKTIIVTADTSWHWVTPSYPTIGIDAITFSFWHNCGQIASVEIYSVFPIDASLVAAGYINNKIGAALSVADQTPESVTINLTSYYAPALRIRYSFATIPTAATFDIRAFGKGK